MVEVITRYRCAVCGSEYADQRVAARCEATVLPPCPVSVGDEVECYERYNPPELDRVVSISIGPGMLRQQLEVATGAEVDRLLAFHYPMHEYIVSVERTHRMSKDDNSYTVDLTLENIRRPGGEWLSPA